MAVEMKAPGGAVAGAAAPSVGDVLRFAAYAAGLAGEGRVGDVAWHADVERLFLDVTDASHGDVLAHLLGLEVRSDHWHDDPARAFSSWSGMCGGVSVFLRAPLALGGLPAPLHQYEFIQRMREVA